MYKTIVTALMLIFTLWSVWASFMYQEIDPICSISGTTHTSFPGEISDTSSWSIPTAYQGECIDTPELSESEQNRINNVMVKYFNDKDFTGPVYGNEWGYGWEDSLNPAGQKFVNEVFFPVIVKYIQNEVTRTNPNLRNIAVLNQAVMTIWYDYFIGQN